MRMPEMAPRLRDCRPRRAGRGSPARRPRCPCLSRMRRTGPAPKRSRCATFGRVCASGPRGPGRVSDPGRRARAARRRWAPVRAAMPSRGRPGWSRAQRPAMPRATRDTRARARYATAPVHVHRRPSRSHDGRGAAGRCYTCLSRPRGYSRAAAANDAPSDEKTRNYKTSRTGTPNARAECPMRTPDICRGRRCGRQGTTGAPTMIHLHFSTAFASTIGAS